MEQKDYLLRYFDQLAIVLAHLAGFKQKGKSLEAVEAINKALVGLKLPGMKELTELPVSEILTILKTQSGLGNVELEIIAELLFEAGEFQAELGQKKLAHDSYKKALILFDHLSLSKKIYSFDREDKVKQIKRKLEA